MIAFFADKLIISTENNSLACRCLPGPQPNRYPRAIQTSETTPCVVLRSAGKARYASYPPLDLMLFRYLWRSNTGDCHHVDGQAEREISGCLYLLA